MSAADSSLDEAVVVALGSNLPGAYPSSEALLEQALEHLGRRAGPLVSRSRWWRSKAWPRGRGPDFVNGVAILNSDLEPRALLQTLHAIESDFGRERGLANAPRTLDLDLIAVGRAIMGGPPRLPHPRAHERLFVMGPLAEIAPAWIHPELGRSALDLLKVATVGLDAR